MYANEMLEDDMENEEELGGSRRFINCPQGKTWQNFLEMFVLFFFVFFSPLLDMHCYKLNFNIVNLDGIVNKIFFKII